MLDVMFSLSVHTAAIILTIVLAVLGLAYLLLGWLRKRSGRVLLRGLGLILIPVGLLAMGLMDMVVNGINAVIAWANAHYMTTWIMAGLIVAGLGLVLFVIGSFIPHVTGDEANARRQAMRDRKLASLQSGTPAPAKPAATATASVSAAPSAATPATGDDPEIDDILKRHGIE